MKMLAMETLPFKPNYEQITALKQIVPFGRASTNTTSDPISISFNICASETAERIEEDNKNVVSNTEIYRPPVAVYQPSTYKISEFTVKVTNIHNSLTQNDVFSLMREKGSGLFIRCHLVLDKETKISKGVAYVTCSTIDNARELAKRLRGFVVEGLVISSELLTQ